MQTQADRRRSVEAVLELAKSSTRKEQTAKDRQ